MNKNRIVILLVLSVTVLTTLACAFSGVSLGNDSARISVTLGEKEINSLVEKTNDRIEDEDVLLKDITSVDMLPGFLRVFGTYDKRDGSQGEGSYDITMSAEDGRLKVGITGVSIEGMELSDRRIERMNRELAENMEESYRDSHGEVKFEAVEITDDILKITIQTKINR